MRSIPRRPVTKTFGSDPLRTFPEAPKKTLHIKLKTESQWYSPIQSPEPIIMSAKDMEVQANITKLKRPRTCYVMFFSCLNGWIHKNPKCLLWLKFLYEIVLTNSILACLFILFMKGYDDAIFWKWSGGRLAVLGNWNLQIANSMLIVTFALTELLSLRICLIAGCLFYVIYSLTSPISVMVDMGIFNFVMVLLNIYHAVVLLYQKRYIDFPDELEQIYTVLFSRYMTRVQFKELADIAVIRRCKARVTMKEEGDFVTSLCILVNGQVDVRRKGCLLNVLYKNEILEAPDWVRTNLNPEGKRFDVSFVTATNVIYIKFSRELLVGVIKNNHDICSAVLAVLSIRVSEIWLRGVELKVRESMSNPSSTCRNSNKINLDLSLGREQRIERSSIDLRTGNYIEIKPEQERKIVKEQKLGTRKFGGLLRSW